MAIIVASLLLSGLLVYFIQDGSLDGYGYFILLSLLTFVIVIFTVYFSLKTKLPPVFVFGKIKADRESKIAGKDYAELELEITSLVDFGQDGITQRNSFNAVKMHKHIHRKLLKKISNPSEDMWFLVASNGHIVDFTQKLPGEK